MPWCVYCTTGPSLHTLVSSTTGTGWFSGGSSLCPGVCTVLLDHPSTHWYLQPLEPAGLVVVVGVSHPHGFHGKEGGNFNIKLQAEKKRKIEGKNTFSASHLSAHQLEKERGHCWSPLKKKEFY